jgi:hypothetical protein
MATREPEDHRLSQNWLRHLRDRPKTTVALPCRYCRDKKVFLSNGALHQHMRDAHSDKTPRRVSDRSAVEIHDPIRAT